MNKLTWSTVALAVVAACGTEVVTGGAGGSGAGSAGVGASGPGSVGATSTGTGQPADPCPPAQPNGSPCSAPEGFRCSYGSSVRTDCRSAVVCMNGQWTGGTSACSQSTGCPKPSTLPSGPCGGSEGAFCTYDKTVCACSACLGGPCMAPPIQWQCSGPPTGPGCPTVAPNDGTPCNQPGAQCAYGFVCSSAGAQIECKNGLWYWNTMIACGG